MEQYVYFSIIFFSLIIFFLYIYILYEKTLEFYKNKKMDKYAEALIPFIDSTIDKIKNGQELDCDILEDIKKQCNNKYKRELIEKRLLYYIENLKEDSRENITKLCEHMGVVQYEIDMLKARSYHQKALAAKTLGEFRSKKAIEALLKEIHTKDNDVKYNILLALAKIGDEEAFIQAFENIDSSVHLSERSLIEIVDSFEGDKNKIYKHMIDSDNNFSACVFIKSAGNYKDKSLSEAISKYLFSEDKERRIAAVKAIGNMADAAYINDIIKLLKDSEWEVRAIAAKVLNNFKDSRILSPLGSSLSDSQWYVRYNAATSILNNDEGINTIFSIFKREDKFAKDIIISAMENSPDNKLYLYENSQDGKRRALAEEIKKYLEMRDKEIENEHSYI